MKVCNFCGVAAVDEQTGECTYCPGHKARLKAEGAGQAGDAGDAPSEVPNDISNVLNGSVAQVADAIEGITEVPMLQAIRDAELAGKGRKGVLAAIDARNAALAGAQ